MWELMRIGIEMQQRMIEVHAKGLNLTQQALSEAEKQADPHKAAAEARRAQNALVDQWYDLWRWRI